MDRVNLLKNVWRLIFQFQLLSGSRFAIGLLITGYWRFYGLQILYATQVYSGQVNLPAGLLRSVPHGNYPMPGRQVSVKRCTKTLSQ